MEKALEKIPPQPASGDGLPEVVELEVPESKLITPESPVLTGPIPYELTIHYDNKNGFDEPRLYVWYDGGTREMVPSADDAFGACYRIQVDQLDFSFKFKDGKGSTANWEDPVFNRQYHAYGVEEHMLQPPEIWCSSRHPFVYPEPPRMPEAEDAPTFLRKLPRRPDLYYPATGGPSGLGANLLADGRCLFGLYHPNAARVYLVGTFNDWQWPGHETPDPARFLEMKLYRGYFGIPNTWLAVVEGVNIGDEYKFVVVGGVPHNEGGKLWQFVTDPYARRLAPAINNNNAIVEDPGSFRWNDKNWQTPTPDKLVLYELSVWGFTDGDPDILPEDRGKFRGITSRIRRRYFNRLGVSALSLMPLAEVPTPQGPRALGYNPSLFCTVERDFGTPDHLREMVDWAHRRGLAVLLDQVFNHTSNDFNPLWRLVLEHPSEEYVPDEGGLYFSGRTDWGNRVATEKSDVQNLLIDACKLAIKEYHVDGFRFDATHTNYMDHRFLHRLAAELKTFKPDVILIAENLPNQPDLNMQGFDGFGQWCNEFHDAIKAMLREGTFEDRPNSPERLGNAFYFSRDTFALHTNNVVNYIESHDEHSVPREISFRPELNNRPAKDRKGRLGVFATMVALGQPMLYMGQEFNEERERNVVTVTWPASLGQQPFFQWTSALIQLRRRYPGLRLFGFNPADEGRFSWILGPWMDERHGSGHRVIGWRARPSEAPWETIVVMLNFEPYPVVVDVPFGLAGRWVKLADIDGVNDLPPKGNNSAFFRTALHSADGNFGGFELPDSSAFIYKWEAP